MAKKTNPSRGGPLIERRASSLGEIIEAAVFIARDWVPNVIDPQELWFRGQSRADHHLLPGLYRAHVRDFHYDEGGLFERFRILSTPFLPSRPANEWEWYFLAQHHGLPTRLLDWSESLLTATYFALCETVYRQTRLAIEKRLVEERQTPVFDDESPVVWVMDAGTLNMSVTGDDYPYVPGGPLTKQYLPHQIENKTRKNRSPLAILPTRANERITAQQGVFTVHGHLDVPLELLAAEPGSRIRLGRIILDRANVAYIWDELQYAGHSRLGMFPSIDSAAEHTKWIMQAARSFSTKERPKMQREKKKKGPKKPIKPR